MTLFTQSVRQSKCSHKSFTVVMATKRNKTSLIKNRWHSCDGLLMCGDKTFCQCDAGFFM